MSYVGTLSHQVIPDTVPCYEKKKIVQKTLNEEERGIMDRIRAGVHRILSWGSEGIDMRGKTNRPVKSYYIGGMIHFLDPTGYHIVEAFLKKFPKLNAFLKDCLEHNKWKELAMVYYDALGLGKILPIRKKHH